MSYSISLRAATVAAAMAAIQVKMTEVVTQQACHAKDKDQAIAAAESFLKLLPEVPAGKEIAVTMSGYLSGTRQGNEMVDLTGVSGSVAVAFV